MFINYERGEPGLHVLRLGEIDGDWLTSARATSRW